MIAKKAGWLMSYMMFLTMLKRIELSVTVVSDHLFAIEMVVFPHEKAGMALAHTIKNKEKAAYCRSYLLEPRLTVMDD